MNDQKPTVFDLLLAAAFTLVCSVGAALSWAGNAHFATLVLSLFALMSAWSLTGSWRQGTRPATIFERFEHRLFLRTLLVVFGGGFIVFLIGNQMTAAASDWSPAAKAILLLSALALWLGATLRTASRLRGRSESAGAYKRRVGYSEAPADSDDRTD